MIKPHYLRALRPLIHMLVIAWGFWASYQLRQYTDLIPKIQIRIPPFVISELIMFAGISIGLYILIWRQNKLFQLYGLVLWYYQRFIKTIIVWSITITCIAFFGGGFLFHTGVSRFVIVATALISWIGITIMDGIVDTMLYRMGRKYQIWLIATDEVSGDEVYTLLTRTTSARITTISYQDWQPNQASNFDTIVLVWWLPKKQLQSLADQITISGQEFFHIQDDHLLQDMIFQPQKLWPLVGLEYKASVINEWSLVFKRGMDIVWSIVGIILLSPIMWWIAYRIRCEDGWPALFVQRRVWLGGREFNFIKFRSMKLEYCTGPWYGWPKADKYYETLIKSELNTRSELMPKIHNDPRITNIGKWLRETSLDELPQFFNVLLGHMSLIGPRPHLPREVAQYEPWQHRLFVVKPGITWYAQIFGRDTLDFNEEAKLDLYYIQNRSIFLDMYVLFATLGVVSKGR